MNVSKVVILKTIRHPETDEIIIRPDELITADIAKQITDAGIEQMYIRSAFTCNTRHGVCENVTVKPCNW